jgi:hypothetical protein
MASNFESVVEMPKTVTEVDVHGTFDGQPVKTHKLKKPVKDCLKEGRASMIPPVLDSPSKCAHLDFAADAPPTPPGRNLSCSSTFPGENQHPPSTGQNYDFVSQSKKFLTLSVAANMDLFSYFFNDFSYHLSHIKRIHLYKNEF